MNEDGFERAATFWERRDADTPANARMSASKLRGEIEVFLRDHRVGALATATVGAVRCTPLEYFLCDGAICIFSEGGRKFYGLAENPQVSFAVFEASPGFGSLSGLQIDGVADVLEPGDAGYAEAAEARGISLEALAKLPEPMYLIRIVPRSVDYLCSDLKVRGFSSRQHFEWE